MDRPSSPIDQRRLFAVAVVASIVLHAVALVLGPGAGSVHRDDTPRVVEVRLQPAVVALADQAEPSVPSTPTRVARAVERRALPAPKPAPVAPAPDHHVMPAPHLPNDASGGPRSSISEPGRDPAAVEAAHQSSVVEPPQPAMPGSAADSATATADRASVAYLHTPPPRYPASARRNGESGNVALKVLVSADGSVRRVEIENSSGSRALDVAARDAVQGWRFVPARRGMNAVDAWVIIQVVFRLQGSE